MRNQLNVCGLLKKVQVVIANKCYCLDVIVVDTGNHFKALLGRSWLNVINPDWHQMILSNDVTINSIESTAHKFPQSQQEHKHPQYNPQKQSLPHTSTKESGNLKQNLLYTENIFNDISKRFPCLLSTDPKISIKNYMAELHINDCKPIFHKAYSVPLRLREKVSDEIDRLVSENIISPVQHSQWASPLVVVPKPDGSIRLLQ